MITRRTLRLVLMTAIFAVLAILPFREFMASAQSVGTVLQGPVYLKNANLKPDANTVGSLTKAQMLDRTRAVQLPIGSFVLATDGSHPLASVTVPVTATVNAGPALQWAVGDTAKVSTNFTVPDDYVSGAAFICMGTLGAASADTTLDFDVYVNTAAVAYDAAATNQTPVAVTNSATLNINTTLTVATDTVAAGAMVTFNLWRAAGTGSGATYNLKGCRFVYTADM